MQILLRLTLVSAFTVFIFGNLIAQESNDTTTKWLVETINGNEYIGTIIYQDTAKLKIITKELGEITIQRHRITNIEKLNVEAIVDGMLWFDNPHATRYFYGPNGYGLRKGEAYYQNTWILFNHMSYGMFNNFSIGVGIMPLFLFAGTSTPVWITPKFSVPVVKDKLNLGAGVLLATLLGEGESFGIGYGVATIGNRDKNLTLGLGYGFSSNGWADKPTITLSGMARVGRKAYLLTENYYIGMGDFSLVLISFGGRSVQKKLAIDYGLIIPLSQDMDSFVAIPWLGITVPFRKAE